MASTSSSLPADRAVARWLLCCCVLVALMVAVGGMTRLTESGLSIVQWKPLSGILPPLSHGAWEAEFEAYKQYPQYSKSFMGMRLEEFKDIFWLEYWHRVLGRVIGAVFLLPFLYFLIRRRFSALQAWTLGGIFLLGGAQGAMGWYMVKSGLVDVPWVSPYRLTAHLLLAFSLFGLLWWQALRFAGVPRGRSLPLLTGVTWLLLVVQIALGGFVAGNDAGMIYNSWPLMDGQWMPPEIWNLPLMTNHAFVNWLHRWLAIGVFALVWVHYLRQPRQPWYELWAAVTLLQLVLGIATLLQVVPVGLATIHQVTALLVFAIGVTIWYQSPVLDGK